MRAAEPVGRSGTRPVLLYLYPRRSVFIDRDLDLLGPHFQVRTHELLRGPKWALPFRLLAQLLFLVRNRAWRRTAICHFAGYHGLLPALWCRHLVIVLAGSDCASFPAMGYGNFRKALYGWATSFSVRRARRLLPVHHSLMGMEQDYDPDAPRNQGLKAFVPDLHTPFTEVPYGFDATYWSPDTGSRDPQLYLCVASGTLPDNNTHARKGVDLVLKVAPLLPDARFLIIGSPEPGAYQDLPPNVTVEGRQHAEALREHYRRARYLLQVSVMEGFPNALCEGMLCGCIPIVSTMAAMPDIVGGTGALVTQRTAESLMEAILSLQALSEEQLEVRSRSARERVAARWTPERRQQELLAALSAVDAASPPARE